MYIKPRGTRDLYGQELGKIQHVFGRVRGLLVSHGYGEVRTPTFEDEGIFHDGDNFMMANQEFFHLGDGEKILRPENTAPIARFIAENRLLNSMPSPLQFFYFGPFFRYERPQRGRYREFYQLGIEKVNAQSPDNDIENILLVRDICGLFNLELKLHLNYLSGREIKARWNVALSDYFRRYEDHLTDDSRARIGKNPLRILDDKLDGDRDFVKNAPSIEEFLSEESTQEMSLIRKKLDELGIPYVWDRSLVRGIDYYTGLIYEWKYGDITVIAGGRYDELLRRFLGRDVPALGLAMGVERMVLCLNEIGYEWPPEDTHGVYLAALVDPDPALWGLLSSLRESGLIVRVNWDIRTLKGHFSQSDRLGIDRLLIYGERERSSGSITIRFGGAQANYPLRDHAVVLEAIGRDAL